MPTSATGNNDQGFTLIELMIVMTIIALASAVVVFAVPDPRGRVIDEAERFAARVHAARDDAVVQARDVRVSVTARGYRVERRRRGVWEALNERPFKPVEWASETSAIVGTSGQQAITFDSTGTPASPAAVTIVRDTAQVTVTVAGNGDVRVGS